MAIVGSHWGQRRGGGGGGGKKTPPAPPRGGGGGGGRVQPEFELEFDFRRRACARECNILPFIYIYISIRKKMIKYTHQKSLYSSMRISHSTTLFLDT